MRRPYESNAELGASGAALWAVWVQWRRQRKHSCVASHSGHYVHCTGRVRLV